MLLTCILHREACVIFAARMGLSTTTRSATSSSSVALLTRSEPHTAPVAQPVAQPVTHPAPVVLPTSVHKPEAPPAKVDCTASCPAPTSVVAPPPHGADSDEEILPSSPSASESSARFPFTLTFQLIDFL